MSRRVSTVVITAASTIDLTLLADFKVDWSIPDATTDAFLARAITRSSAAAAQFCNRVFGAETVQETFTFRKENNPNPIGRVAGPLQLSRRPTVTLVSVTENATPLVNGVDYSVDQITGQMWRLDAAGNETWWSNYSIVVNYIGGYILPTQTGSFPGGILLPVDIQDAVSRMVYSRFAERSRDPFIKTEVAFGIGTTEYDVSDPDGNLSADVDDILSNYRDVVIA